MHQSSTLMAATNVAVPLLYLEVASRVDENRLHRKLDDTWI